MSRPLKWAILETDNQKLKFLVKALEKSFFVNSPVKGQLNSGWIYEVIVSPKMLTKNFKDFCPTL